MSRRASPARVTPAVDQFHDVSGFDCSKMPSPGCPKLDQQK